MKLFIALIAGLSVYNAQADSFTIIRDGQQYLCQPTSVDPGTGIECVNKAYNGPFTRDEAMQLCTGARSTAPADCAIRAYNGPYTKSEAIQLCTRARSTGPVDCATKAYNGPFTKAESLSLCAGDTTVANADCAIKAYNGPYSKEEAIRMCKDQPLLVLRSLNLIEQSTDLKEKVQTLKNRLQ